MGCDAQIKTKMGVQEAFKWCGLGGGGIAFLWVLEGEILSC
jgi:hypothetical protein